MKFVSTRGIFKGSTDAAYAIKRGLAEDGGLFMPEAIPALGMDELSMLIGKSYPERAAHVIGKFLTDYTYDELLCDAREAYSEKKFGAHPAPVVGLGDGRYVLELWHGPTSAFKDMALQIMPRLFVRALKKCGETRRALILVATSGDTGKAALEGYRDVEGTMIEVFYPTDGVSAIQKLQMQTQEGKGVRVIGIRGNFDDAQNGVKRIFASSEIASRLNESGVFLSSANSINWGRLVPQIVYYVSAYLDMVSSGDITMGERIDVIVPTGNFGNIFAAYIAKLMGLPIEKLVCASNKNDVLTEFLTTGVYNKNREFYQTVSPSMDILISSNLERLLYLTAGQERTAKYMDLLNSEGYYKADFDVMEKIRESFIGICADEDATVAEIGRIFKEKNYLIDTHTAVASYAARVYTDTYKAERKVLIASTASAYKFAKDALRALSPKEACGISDTEALEMLAAATRTEIPTPLAGICKKTILHSEIIGTDEMNEAVIGFACDQ